MDDFFGSQLTVRQRKRIEAACVDMWEPFRLSIEQWSPQCKIACDRFHIMQHANDAVDEVRRAEFFRQGPKKPKKRGQGLPAEVDRSTEMAAAEAVGEAG